MLSISKGFKSYLLLVIFLAQFSQVFPDEIPTKKESKEPTALESLMQFKEKAVFFHPDKYSKSEWEKANSLIKDLQAKQKENSNISKEEFSKLISGARASLETCMKNSFEPAWKELSNSAEEGIKEAETAFAESLSSRNYDKSRELLQEANLISSNFSEKLQETKTSKDNSKIWSSLLEDGYSAFSKWKDSIESSKKAKEQSIAQSEQLIATITDLDIDLVNTKDYSKKQEDVEKVKEFREKLNLGISLVQKGKIKEGFLIVEKVRLDSAGLINSTISPKVKEDIKTAEEKIISAEKEFKKLNSKVDDEDFQEEYKKTMDSLNAAKEALGFSKDLFREERFTESIGQSEESIRLAYLAEEMSISLEKKQKDLPLKKEEAKNEEPSEKEDRNSIPEPPKKETPEDVSDNNENKIEDFESNPDDEEGEVLGELENPDKDSNETEEETLKPNKTVDKKPKNSGSLKKLKSYKVKKTKPNETLSGIAKKVYGKSSYWKKIYKANKKKIKNPDLIYPNQILLIPR